MRMFFDTDDDGHWYCLPLEKRSEFIKALEDISLSEFYSNEYWEKSEEFTNQFDEYRLELSPMSYSFENIQEIKND